MTRKLERGYAPLNLAKLIERGQEIELSIIPVGEQYRAFFRERGHSHWQPVMTARKDGPLAYKSAAIGALIERLNSELPSATIQMRVCNRVFCHTTPDSVAAQINSHFLAAPPHLQASLLALLKIQPASPDPAWEIVQLLIYPSELDTVTREIARQMLALPTGWDNPVTGDA